MFYRIQVAILGLPKNARFIRSSLLLDPLLKYFCGVECTALKFIASSPPCFAITFVLATSRPASLDGRCTKTSKLVPLCQHVLLVGFLPLRQVAFVRCFITYRQLHTSFSKHGYALRSATGVPQHYMTQIATINSLNCQIGGFCHAENSSIFLCTFRQIFSL